MAFRTSLRNHAIARLRCRSFEAFRAVFAPPMQASAPDLIHCHDSMPLLAAQRTAQLTGAALIYDSHELEAHRNIFMPSYLRAKIMDVEARILPKADGVITVSDCFADDLAQMYSIARPHVDNYFVSLCDAASGGTTGSTSNDYAHYDKIVETLRQENLDTQIEKCSAWVGTPKEVIDMIADYNDQVGGFDDGSLQVNFTTLPADEAEISVRLFGEKVIPHFS